MTSRAVWMGGRTADSNPRSGLRRSTMQALRGRILAAGATLGVAMAYGCSAEQPGAPGASGSAGLPVSGVRRDSGLSTAAPREFRGVWIATVNHIDWPSRPGLSVEVQKHELTTLLDLAVDARLNAVIFQVRPAGDAFYRSQREPWSEWLTGAQGRPPREGFDPLGFVIEEAHRRGLELHAWFNPFRARHATAKSGLAANHLGTEHPSVSVRYGDQLWFDPSSPIVRRRVHDEIVDVVDRYDVDGVHIDDYFYPYKKAGLRFDDDVNFQDYRRRGGTGSRSDWRRSHVNEFVRGLDRSIHQRKPWVKFGISPFGIVRPGVPSGIEAGVDQYEDLAADVRLWLREGIVDYIAPQLYWPIAQRKQSFPRLLEWWSDATPRDVHLFVGNFATKAQQGARGWSLRELAEQIRMTQDDPGASGNILFSAKVLRDESFRRGLRDRVFGRLALVPPSPWLGDGAPTRPELDVREVSGNLELRWQGDPSTRFWSVYIQRGDGSWQLADVKGAGRPGLRIPASMRIELGIRAVAVASVDRAGNEGSHRVVTIGR